LTVTSRPRSHVLEDLARARLLDTFADVGWTVEVLAEDYGEDFLVRIFDDGKATPWSFFVQSKAATNVSRYLIGDGRYISYPVKSSHLAHWAEFWEPVFLTLWDADADVMYWEYIQEHLEYMRPRRGNKPTKTARIRIPIDQVLSPDALKLIRVLTKARFERYQQQRAGAERLLEILQEEWGVKVEYGAESEVVMLPKGRFVPDPSGDTTVVVFGKVAKMVGRLAEEHGVELDDAYMLGIIDLYGQVAEALLSGGVVEVIGKDGSSVISWRSLAELDRFLARSKLR